MLVSELLALRGASHRNEYLPPSGQHSHCIAIILGIICSYQNMALGPKTQVYFSVLET